MPDIEINGAQIHYELLGEDQPDQAPILLIHGATGTGQDDWGTIAPILARNWRVILPDCRGHGRSSSTHSYSFSEMADDLAKLVRALGYERAHVIGHSNGGNVALVMLVEHPEVIRTAILQAANAFVSQDLFEREPALFDAERVKRESPGWMESMIRLHGPTHGADYWRELLALTVTEILRAPNYTPDILGAVQRPALIIQGAADPVNAPARHAQFIAENIPYAEAWIPKGVGHTVHDELPTEWLAVVKSFIERRGDPFNDALHHLKEDEYADSREWVFDLRARQDAEAPGKLLLTGQVLTKAQLDAARQAAHAASGEAAQVDSSRVSVLLTPEAPWALVNRSVTDLFARPTIHSGRSSQGLIGEAVRILETSGEWARVHMARDGYMGWVQTATLYMCDIASVHAYQSACTHRVLAELPPAWAALEKAGDLSETVGKLVFGCPVIVDEVCGDYARVRLPDGRAWWTRHDGLLPREKWLQPDADGIAETLNLVRRFAGIPYLWGGRSTFGYDCSGLTGMFWDFMGVSLPRDADQQRRAGKPFEGAPQPGDLLFFVREPENEVEGRADAVSHVALSLGGDRFLHASGTEWGVTYNSLNPEHRDFSPKLRDRFLDARRYAEPGGLS